MNHTRIYALLLMSLMSLNIVNAMSVELQQAQQKLM